MSPAELVTQVAAAKALDEPPYVIQVAAYLEGIPVYRHPQNGKARCFDRKGMARLRKAVARYRQNRDTSEASICA